MQRPTILPAHLSTDATRPAAASAPVAAAGAPATGAALHAADAPTSGAEAPATRPAAADAAVSGAPTSDALPSSLPAAAAGAPATGAAPHAAGAPTSDAEAPATRPAAADAAVSGAPTSDALPSSLPAAAAGAPAPASRPASRPAAPVVAVLAGPTAVGKTQLAIALARELQAEIVVADALCVYRGMDIGTAKPGAEDQAAIPHHCMDLVEPTDEFSVAQYQSVGQPAIAGIRARGRLPLVVGGTGLYIRAAIDDIRFAPPPDPEYRAAIEALGHEDLVSLLRALSPYRACRTDLRNPRRVARQVELLLQGVDRDEEGWSNLRNRWDVRYAVVAPRDRKALYERIDERCDAMLATGWLDEVATLSRQYPIWSKTAAAAIGYSELRLVWQGEMSMADAVKRIRRRTRSLVRRQLTWFRREPRARWFEPEEGDNLRAFLAGETNTTASTGPASDSTSGDGWP